jgi:hypothetical protein
MTTVQDLCKTLQRISWADLSDSDDETENISAGPVVAAPTKKPISWADLSDSDDDDDDVIIPPKMVRSLAKPTVDPPVILLPSPSPSPILSESSVDSESQENQENQENQEKEEKERVRRAEIKEKTVNGIRTLVARNLPRDITVHQLRSKFENFGIIQDIYIPRNMDRSSPYFGTVKGFSLIKFLRPEEATRAFETLYKRLRISNNCIFLEFAKQDRDR